MICYEFQMLFLVCCLLLPFYEFTRCVIEGRKLSLLLRQRLTDSILHENQNKYVILYYKIAHKEYRVCFSIMLVSIFIQNLALSILYLTGVFMNDEIQEYDHDYLSYFEYNFILFTNDKVPVPLAIALFTFGNSIQILPYLIVSFRRIFRYIRNRRMRNRDFRLYRSSLKHLIEENNSAYNRRMRYYF